MDLTALFTRAWKVVWPAKPLWALGMAIAACGGQNPISATIQFPTFTPGSSRDPSGLPSEATLDLYLRFADWFTRPEVILPVICGSLFVSLIGLAIASLAEGALVEGVRQVEHHALNLDQALACQERSYNAGKVSDLDLLPFPDWSPFSPRKFRIGYDFTRFPTGLIQQSRGCTLKCNYCPYIILENAVRLRTPESVVAEMRAGIQAHGFRSFKFRDPLFGVDRKRVSTHTTNDYRSRR